MSISSEITRISGNIEAAYTALGEKGATLPESQNSDNLADTIATVPQGGGGASIWEAPPDGYYKVTFVDYDGTILKEEQVARGQAVEPPTAPSHSHLTFDSWNRADYTTVYENLLVGAVYSLPLSETVYKIKIEEANTQLSFYFTYVFQNLASGSSEKLFEGTIDWGDESTDTTITMDKSNTSSYCSTPVSHTYAEAGEYYIRTYMNLETADISNDSYHPRCFLTKADWNGTSTSISLPTSTISAEQLIFVTGEEFKELTELYISCTVMTRAMSPFLAPNLEKIAFCLDTYLNSKGGQLSINTYTSNFQIMWNKNKIKHMTFPSKFWKGSGGDRKIESTINIEGGFPLLETVTYGLAGYEVKLAGMKNMKICYNMQTAKYSLTETKSTQLHSRFNCSGFYPIFTNPSKAYKGVNNNSLYLSNEKLVIDLRPYTTFESNFNSVADQVVTYNYNDLTKLKEVEVIPNGNNLYSTSFAIGTSSGQVSNLSSITIDWSKVQKLESITCLASPYLNGVLDLSDCPVQNLPTTFTDVSQSPSSSSSGGIFYNTFFKKIILPSGLKYLGVSFQYCFAEEIVIPNTLVGVNGYSNWSYMKRIKNIDLGNATSSANTYYSFVSYCPVVEAISIPKSIKFSSSSAFSNCPSLRKVWVPSSADLSKATSSSYTMIGNGCPTPSQGLEIWTDASSKPSAWGSYWDKQYSSGSSSYTVHWGSTKAQYDAA